MSSLEEDLKDKIKTARKEQYKQEDKEFAENEDKEEIADIPAKEDVVTEDEVVEDEQDVAVEQKADDSDDFEEMDTKGEEFKELAPDAKKFYHMRKEAKEKEKEMQLLRERLARIEGAQSVQQKPAAEAEAEVEDIPDRVLEPEAYLDYELQKKDKRIQEMEDRFSNYEQKTTFSESEKLYQNLEDKYTVKDPSYKDAKAYLVETLGNEIRQTHPAATQAEISKHLKDQEYILVSNLAKAGWSENAIFNSIKAQAYDKGFKDAPTKSKADKTKLRRNMDRSANLNDAPSAAADLGFSGGQLNKLGIVGIAQLTNDPVKMEKAQIAVRRARIKAMA